ncbi:hypothetical protein Tco_0677766 [Tanacetum coccineum]|uniref:Xylulose kinase-1 n=1 Tax=Tanacetum coccineum TaxID=301880 RepID=A0ABQ4XDQ7_9ASTR
MSDLKFVDTHNLVVFLEKPTESEGFEEIVDFLNANPIKYALTVNPKIYCSCVKKLWDTVKVKMVNGEVQLQALVDKKKVIIIESIIRRDLQQEDANGVDCLPNAVIFEQLTLMRILGIALASVVYVVHSMALCSIRGVYMIRSMDQFKIQKVWTTLLILPYGKKAMVQRWVYRIRKMKGVSSQKQARQVSTQRIQTEEGIDYDEGVCSSLPG